ncbi:Conserved_hypothetical protein [Hexamita inflata]|uniref:Uncharacterized protein n=1 Tax=Hexamita inflata TaxID=28002 RepID=A0AA86UQI1_9EUKA|nr:Conserved hypothetical protein [Hexamita inflata]
MTNIMQQLKDILMGKFKSRTQLLIYGAVMLLTFSAFMLSAWLTFNHNIWVTTGSKERYYAPWEYTFSKLGSFDAECNPHFFLLFSACLWSLVAFDIPLTFFMHRHNAIISKPGAIVSSVFYVIGWLGIFLDGCFCSSHRKIGNSNVEFMSIHIKVSGAGMGGFAIALFNNAVLMFRDRFTWVKKVKWANHSGRNLYKCHGHVFAAAAIMAVILIVSIICLNLDIKVEKPWMKYVIGGEIQENICICGLILTMVWNAMVMPVEIPTFKAVEETQQLIMRDINTENKNLA